MTKKGITFYPDASSIVSLICVFVSLVKGALIHRSEGAETNLNVLP